MPSRAIDRARPRDQDGRRHLVKPMGFAVLLVVLLAIVVASRGGVFEPFERAEIDRVQVLLYGAVGASVGAAVALLVTRSVRRRANAGDLPSKDPASNDPASNDPASKDLVSALAVVLVSLGAIVAITLVPHDPPSPDAGSGSRPGTTVAAPSPDSGPDSSVPLRGRGRSSEDVGSGLMGVVIALGMAAMVAVMLAYRGRPRSDPRMAPFDRPRGSRAESMVDDEAAAQSFAHSARILLTGDDARRAIIAAYAALLDGLAAAGAPRAPHEAPEEHLRRALEVLAIPADDASNVTALFLLARFSSHPVGDADRALAVAALRSAERHLRNQRAAR